jgi:hypothetical protein
MAVLHGSVASIGFYGDDLEPSELTMMLGCGPTVAVRNGGICQTSRGAEKTARTGSWRLIADRREPGDLDGQINGRLDRMTDDLSAWRLFAERFRGRVFCGLFLAVRNGGLTLRSATLQRLDEQGCSSTSTFTRQSLQAD